ncbi:uncharacterized protein LOC109832202 [Asparagus officinalis]|uniref:uncharacterized protein LOC109832202 n=1 Tax=Asparagus officinalis TaxID=4686 RepID=UPI00098E7902|nr:uncharacterized protein LOC109832202 [Asparagus officinalis]XP_020255225.1 uncharacterized protein LOC109832202 [Asparagus officinalis]
MQVISPRFPSSSPLFLLNSNQLPRISSINGRRRLLPSPPRSATDRDEPQQQQLESDKAKAREALKKLDQQLESMVEREQTQEPKSMRPPSPYDDLDLERDAITGMRSDEELPEMSRSYLSYSAVALLIITIFNNIIFNFFIKPSVDGNERSSPIERVPLEEP